MIKTTAAQITNRHAWKIIKARDLRESAERFYILSSHCKPKQCADIESILSSIPNLSYQTKSIYRKLEFRRNSNDDSYEYDVNPQPIQKLQEAISELSKIVQISSYILSKKIQDNIADALPCIVSDNYMSITKNIDWKYQRYTSIWCLPDDEVTIISNLAELPVNISLWLTQSILNPPSGFKIHGAYASCMGRKPSSTTTK